MTERVVSLIASATEIVAALGYESRLVGRSHSCDFPPMVESLPVCTEARIDLNGNSLEIDTRVRDAVRDAFSIYRVFQDQLDELSPTLIITQTQCEVCAVNLREVEETVCNLISTRPQIVALEPMVLDDLWGDIRKVAAALDDETAGELLIQQLQQRTQHLRQQQWNHCPTVACIEWLEPLMIAANWVPELVELAGGEAVLGKEGDHSTYLTWESLLTSDPEVIVIMPCGFGIQRTLSEINTLTDQPHWNSLRAVQNGEVYVTDGHHLFNRSGPRLIDSAEILREILHPETAPAAQQDYWQRLQPGE